MTEKYTDAKIQSFLDRATADRMQREQEAEDRIEAEEEARRAEGRAELEDHARQQLNIWLVNGGDVEGFKAAWPEMEARYMAERQAERDRLINQSSVF